MSAGIDHHHRHRDAGQPAGEPAIAGGEPVEGRIEPAEERAERPRQRRARRRVLLMRLEQQRAERRAQRQRDEARDQRGGGDRHRELAEELAGDARDEGRGDEDRGKHQRDGDERPPTSSMVRCAASRGLMPGARLRSTFSTTTMASSTTMPTASTRPNSDRLLIEKPSRSQHDEGADQRDRDGHDRDDRGPPGLQEQDDDDHHQPDRLEDGLDQLAHGFGDEMRRVVDDVVVASPAERSLTARPSSPAAAWPWRARWRRGAGRSAARSPACGRGSCWRV